VRIDLKIFVLVSAVIFSGCTPMDRLQRLQRKHPYLFEIQPKDTFFVRTSKVDTLHYYNSSSDTFLIIKDSLTIQRILTRDTFRYYYKSRPCTTFSTKQIIQPKAYVQPKSDIETYLRYFIIIFAIALLWKILH
jgi:hypothetical protein